MKSERAEESGSSRKCVVV